MLIKAAINGSRTRAEHPAVPLTPEQQAAEAAAAVRAGAGGIHVHVRGAHGRESLAPDDIARSLEAIRAACPGIPVGVSTGAWIVPDLAERLSLIDAWNMAPDFASVNLHEAGAAEVIRRLLDRGIGVEAGIWNASAARIFVSSGFAGRCLRVLLEPGEDGPDVLATLDAIEAALGGIGRPRLLHGMDASAWPMIETAVTRGYDTRIGLEDTLTLPDGSPAEDNAALVTAARRIAGSS
jgi:uncharacterized protein (DUF849 family)